MGRLFFSYSLTKENTWMALHLQFMESSKNKPVNQRVLGLIGYPLSHSFSKKYFTDKFELEQIPNHRYELFPLKSIEELPELLLSNPNIFGLNVTIPYKQTVIPFLDEIEENAAAIGAVNVIKINEGKLKGFNSDVFGFEKSLLAFLKTKPGHSTDIQALILGTGGASKAVSFVLDKLGIPFKFVSRKKKEATFGYSEIDQKIMEEYRLIINCTPLGTFPDVEACPVLPYQYASKSHFFYDLVYNPAETLFLKKGKTQGALTCNGLAMLHLQAERAWEIWNE